MPFIRTYEQSVSPVSDTFTPRLSNRPAESGLTTLGKGIEAFGELQYKRDLEKDDADYIASAAALKAKLAERRQQAVLDGKAADPEWIETEKAYAEEELSKTVGNLRTKEGKRRAQTRAGVLVSDKTTRLLATHATVAAGIQKNQLQEVEDLTLRAIQQDPTGHSAAKTDFLLDLEGPAYSRLSRDVKEDYARQFKFKAARAFLDGTEQQYGSQAALTALDSVRDDMPAEQYTALRDHFTTRAKQEKTKDREEEQYAFYQRVDAVIDSGGDPRGIIQAAVKDKLVTAEPAFALHQKYEKVVEHRKKVAAADAAFRMGDMVSFEQIEPGIRKEVADAWVAEQLNSYNGANAAAKAGIANGIVRKGVEMDYVFSGLKNSLRASPHGQGFGAAVDLYRSLEAFDPYYAGKYVSEDQRARFDVYTNAVKGGATAEQALGFAQSITPKAIADTKKIFAGAEGKKVADDLRAKLSDTPWSTVEMINGRQAANAVMDRVTVMLAGNPAADVDSLIASAQANYESQNVRMGALWVPRAFLSGVPAKSMVDVADRITTRLPEVLRANKLPVVDGKYVLAPDSTSDRDGRLQVYDPAGFPVPGLRFGPADFKTEFRALKADEYKKAGEKPEDYHESPGLGS